MADKKPIRWDVMPGCEQYMGLAMSLLPQEEMLRNSFSQPSRSVEKILPGGLTFLYVMNDVIDFIQIKQPVIIAKLEETAAVLPSFKFYYQVFVAFVPPFTFVYEYHELRNYGTIISDVTDIQTEIPLIARTRSFSSINDNGSPIETITNDYALMEGVDTIATAQSLTSRNVILGTPWIGTGTIILLNVTGCAVKATYSRSGSVESAIGITDYWKVTGLSPMEEASKYTADGGDNVDMLTDVQYYDAKNYVKIYRSYTASTFTSTYRYIGQENGSPFDITLPVGAPSGDVLLANPA